MTVGVDADLRIREYPGDDSATARAVPFYFLDAGDLKVTRVNADGSETVLVRGTDYSVAGAGNPAGGSVTPLAPIATGTTWRIEGDMTLAQPTDYTAGDDFPAESHERGLDRAMIAAQETRRDLNDLLLRALLFPRGEQGLSLPAAAARAGKFLGFGALGAALMLSGTGNDPDFRTDAADPALGTLLIAFQAEGDNTVPMILRDALAAARTVEWYGAVGDNVTDDTAAIQAMIDDVGYFRLLPKTYRITDSLLVPNGGPYGTLWAGAGMELSALRCDGMAGKAAIKPANVASLYRVTMRDFKVYGDCDTAIDFSGMSGGNQLYASLFLNLWLQSAADSTFKASNHFSTGWNNVHCYSGGGHCFDLEGDVATVLYNCYAHEAGTVGAGKAGYRIKGIATLIECNGLNVGDRWGDFGATVAQDGANVQFRINLIGGNAEDFDVDAIRLRYTGSIAFDTFGFIPKAAGTFNTLINGSEYGASGWKLVDRNSFYSSKGATMSGVSRILHNSAPADIVSTGVFTNMRRTDQSVTYTIPSEAAFNSAFGILARQFGYINYTRSYGFNLQVPTLWTANALTFDVTRLNTIRTANTAATLMRTATGGEKGQRLTIIVEDANTTIVHNYASSGRFLNKSGADIAATNGGVYEYVHNGTNWVQVG